MAYSLVKLKKPFDLLANWPEYIKVISNHFAQPEEAEVWSPAIDVKERDGKYVLRADLPGVRAEDIQVTYKNGYLTIKGKRRRDERNDSDFNHINERYYGSFERVLQFPGGVKESEIQKKYQNGILELTIPIPQEDFKGNKAV